MPKSGADIIHQRIVKERIEAVFAVPGAQIDPLSIHLVESSKPRVIIANHELAAGFMADGYARASLRPGVCIGIGACGAANMLPAAATAAADDSAVIFLTGNVPTNMNGYGAFQDAGPGGSNDSNVFRQFVRYSAMPDSVDTLRWQLDRAFDLAVHPFRSPVHLSIPYDVQTGDACQSSCIDNCDTDPAGGTEGADTSREQITDWLACAKRPCLLVGSRFNSHDAHGLLRQFAEMFCIPVATTLAAKGILSETHALSLGNFGFGGSRRAHEAFLQSDSDAIVLLGADLNERDSRCWDQRIKPNGRRIMRVDSKRANSLGIQVDQFSQSDSIATVKQWVSSNDSRLEPLRVSASERSSWTESLSQTPHTYDSPSESNDTDGTLSLDRVVKILRDNTPDDTNLVVDAGMHRIFAGHYWQARQPGTFFSACGTAPLGWAICSSIGIQLARRDQRVVVLTGDGCMRTHGTELATMARYKLPIVVVVCNNGAYGSIHRRMTHVLGAQDLTHLPPVNWVGFASSLGASAQHIDNETALHEALNNLFSAGINSNGANQGPYLLDIATPLIQEIPHPELLCSSLTKTTSLPIRSS